MDPQNPLALVNHGAVRPGVFRPLGHGSIVDGPAGSVDGAPTYHSAFSPAKKVKVEESPSSSSTSSTVAGGGGGSGDPQSLSVHHGRRCTSDSAYGGGVDGSGLDYDDRESMLHHHEMKDERPSSISSAGCDTLCSEPLSDSGGDGNERGTPDSEGRSLRSKCVFIYIHLLALVLVSVLVLVLLSLAVAP